ncbi:MAG: 1-deoxy-D-xylulose-5-phosphate synthase [Lachnospiraceae bacterium]|jgi:1-deoxy-D-xylulose-5-phosphate synthase
MLLDLINKANDIKKIKTSECEELAREIRRFLIRNVSRTGGHLASNLGVVELTMALHLALDLPGDKIIWDVGHQSYVHKILTGRKDEFTSLRQHGGLSGFPKRRESECDTFNTGHSSTSISAAMGMAQAAKLKGEDSTIVAVIGDGAMTGGMAYEALNNASKLKRNLIIILNDNNMSISENVGGISTYLTSVRAGGKYNDIKLGVVNTLERIPIVGEKMIRNIKKTKDNLKKLVIPGTFFEDMGITYLGPLDGHNVLTMYRIIKESAKLDHPVLIHVCTKKGKGYVHAERNPSKFHGIDAFNPHTGELLAPTGGPTYSSIFAEALIEEARKNKSITAITAAMGEGTGLSAFEKEFPERFSDVGIAEEHAVTFAAGQAAAGLKPFVAIYSSFLQRAYDQIIGDVCIQNLPVTFAVDRAGLVGEDGETHQGLFDLSYMMTIPNMNIFAPSDGKELKAAVKFAADFNGPLAIRYPRGEAHESCEDSYEPIVYGKSRVLHLEKDIAILAVGSMVKVAGLVRERLKEFGRNVTLVDVRFVKPIDEELLNEILENHNTVITMEENVLAGGFGSMMLKLINDKKPSARVLNFAVANSFVEQGSYEIQMKECRLDADSITERLKEELAL